MCKWTATVFYEAFIYVTKYLKYFPVVTFFPNMQCNIQFVTIDYTVIYCDKTQFDITLVQYHTVITASLLFPIVLFYSIVFLFYFPCPDPSQGSSYREDISCSESNSESSATEEESDSDAAGPRQRHTSSTSAQCQQVRTKPLKISSILFFCRFDLGLKWNLLRKK